MRRVLGLLLVVMAGAVVFGCRSGPRNQVGTSAQGSLPASTHPAAPKENIVPLVPYKADGPPDLQFLYPQGWSVVRSATGEQIEFSDGSLVARIMTGPSRWAPAPDDVEGMRAELRLFALNLEVTQLQVDGAEKAFEAKYEAKGAKPPMTVLWLVLFGSTADQSVSIEAPTEVFPQWEPTFREMLRSFKHSDLDHDPLGGKP